VVIELLPSLYLSRNGAPERSFSEFQNYVGANCSLVNPAPAAPERNPGKNSPGLAPFLKSSL
jgi:hypothetical protein